MAEKRASDLQEKLMGTQKELGIIQAEKAVAEARLKEMDGLREEVKQLHAQRSDLERDLKACRRELKEAHASASINVESASSLQKLQARLDAWTPPEPKERRGVLAKYAKLVSSASLGAVTDGS